MSYEEFQHPEEEHRQTFSEQICSVQPMTGDALDLFDDEPLMTFTKVTFPHIERMLPYTITASGDDMRHIGHFSITVSVGELLAKLRTNRAAHVADYEESAAGFQNLCVIELRKRARKIAAEKMDGPRQHWMTFGMRPPVNHERDYTQLIEMLEMAQETEIKLDGSQFRQWVQDEWEWKNEFEATRALYASHS